MTDFLTHTLTRGMALLLVVVLTLTLVPYSDAIAKGRGEDGPVRVGGDHDGVSGYKYRFEIEVGGGERQTYYGEPEGGTPDPVERVKLSPLWFDFTFALLRR